MNQLLPTHRKEGTRIVEYHPTREWVGYGKAVVEQDGRFFTKDGRPMREEDVPAEVLSAAKTAPQSTAAIPGVLTSHTCEHCNQPFLGDAYSAHLLDVVKEMSAPKTVPGLDS